jgi:hypothetical protein
VVSIYPRSAIHASSAVLGSVVSHFIRNLLLALAVLLVAFCAFVAVSVFTTRRNASEKLNDLERLAVSSSPQANWKELQRKYGSKLHSNVDCTELMCQYEITVSNRELALFRRVPYTEMNVWFTVYKGSLQLAMLEYRTALRGPNSPVVHVQEGMCAHGCGVRFDVNPHGTTQQTSNGIVEFDTRATPAQRDAALALNLGCFAQVGGCKDIVDMLPTVWGRTGRRQITSRLRGLSQELEECHCFQAPDE